MPALTRFIKRNSAENNTETEVALGASLQKQKNIVLGGTSASASTSSIMGKTGGYKKDNQNLSGIVLG